MGNGFNILCSIGWCGPEEFPPHRLMAPSFADLKSDLAEGEELNEAALEKRAICSGCAGEDDTKDKGWILVSYLRIRHGLRKDAMLAETYHCVSCGSDKEFNLDRLEAPFVDDIDAILGEHALSIEEAKKHLFCSACAQVEKVKWGRFGKAKIVLMAAYDAENAQSKPSRKAKPRQERRPRKGGLNCCNPTDNGKCFGTVPVEWARTVSYFTLKDELGDGFARDEFLKRVYCNACTSLENERLHRLDSAYKFYDAQQERKQSTSKPRVPLTNSRKGVRVQMRRRPMVRGESLGLRNRKKPSSKKLLQSLTKSLEAAELTEEQAKAKKLEARAAGAEKARKAVQAKRDRKVKDLEKKLLKQNRSEDREFFNRTLRRAREQFPEENWDEVLNKANKAKQESQSKSGSVKGTDPCPCGSGKKLKKCHKSAKEAIKAAKKAA